MGMRDWLSVPTPRERRGCLGHIVSVAITDNPPHLCTTGRQNGGNVAEASFLWFGGAMCSAESLLLQHGCISGSTVPLNCCTCVCGTPIMNACVLFGGGGVYLLSAIQLHEKGRSPHPTPPFIATHYLNLVCHFRTQAVHHYMPFNPLKSVLKAD